MCVCNGGYNIVIYVIVTIRVLLFSSSSIKLFIMTFAFASLRVLILVMVSHFINAQIHHEDSIDLRNKLQRQDTSVGPRETSVQASNTQSLGYREIISSL